jgi:hypothetical protein
VEAGDHSGSGAATTGPERVVDLRSEAEVVEGIDRSELPTAGGLLATTTTIIVASAGAATSSPSRRSSRLPRCRTQIDLRGTDSFRRLPWTDELTNFSGSEVLDTLQSGTIGANK